MATCMPSSLSPLLTAVIMCCSDSAVRNAAEANAKRTGSLGKHDRPSHRKASIFEELRSHIGAVRDTDQHDATVGRHYACGAEPRHEGGRQHRKQNRTR